MLSAWQHKELHVTGVKRPAAGVILAAAVAVVSSFEGTRLLPYRDPAGIETVCTGETQVAMHRYTAEQCADMLRKHLSERYAPPVVACTPSIASHPNAFVAALDAAYNAGPAAYCRSPMAARFNAGQWREGCDAFRGWRITAGGKMLPGLVRRRNAESALCMKDVTT